MNGFMHWLSVIFGLSDLSGPWYGFWSGIGSDIGEIALLGSLYAIYQHHKCSKCWRLSHIDVKGTHYKTCHKHSTAAVHNALLVQHARKYPAQHELMIGGRR